MPLSAIWVAGVIWRLSSSPSIPPTMMPMALRMVPTGIIDGGAGQLSWFDPGASEFAGGHGSRGSNNEVGQTTILKAGRFRIDTTGARRRK